MNRHFLVGLLLPLTLLAGCGKAADSQGADKAAAGPAVAVVNGKEINGTFTGASGAEVKWTATKE